MVTKAKVVAGSSIQGNLDLLTGTGTLFQARGEGNWPVGARLWLFDGTSEPVASTDGGVSVGVPGMILSVPLDGPTFELDFGSVGLPVNAGLGVFVTADSTFTNTFAGSAWHFLNLLYEQ